MAEAVFSSFEFWSWRSKDINRILKKKKKHRLSVSTFCVDPIARIVHPKTRREFVTGVSAIDIVRFIAFGE